MDVAYKNPDYLDIGEGCNSIHELIRDTTAKLFVMTDKLMKKRQRGTKIDPEEWDKLEDLQKLFKTQTSTYQQMVRLNLIEKKESKKEFETDILKTIRDQQSSIGDIVRKIPGT